MLLRQQYQVRYKRAEATKVALDGGNRNTSQLIRQSLV